MKVLINIFVSFVLWVILIFMGAQVLNLLYLKMPYTNFPFWNINFYYIDSVTKGFFVFITLISILIDLAIIVNTGSINLKSRYDKRNYSKLLTTRQRIRGLNRISYDVHGNVTRIRIECLWDYIKFPITSTQNKVCKHFKLPARYMFNTIKKHKSFNQDFYNLPGIPIIAYRSMYILGKYNKVYYLPSNAHTLFIGPTGTGKSVTFVLASIISSIHANESMIIHDTKKELHAHTIELLKEKDYQIFYLDLKDTRLGDNWNPLHNAWSIWKHELIETKTKIDNERNTIESRLKDNDITEDECNELVNKLIDLPAEVTWQDCNMSKAVELIADLSLNLCYEADAKQPTWWQGAADMIAGALLYLFEEGNENYINFASVNALFDDDEALIRAIESRPIDAQSRIKLSTFIASKDVTRASFLATFRNKIRSLLLTEDIIKMTSSKQAFDLRGMFEKPTVVFLFSQSEKNTYYPLITTFINQFYEVAIAEANKMSNKSLKNPFKIFLDELAVLPAFKEIISMYTVSRGYNITFIAFIQSISQLQNIYGNDITKIIIDNNRNKIFLGGSANDTNDYFSQQCGNEAYYDKTTKKWINRPLVSTDRLNKLSHGQALLVCNGWDPYITRLPAINSYTFYRKPNFNYSAAPTQREKVETLNLKHEIRIKSENINDDKGAYSKSYFDKIQVE